MRVHTKQGDVDVGGNGRAEPGHQIHPVTGEVAFVDAQGAEHRLRPTFEALVEIEDALGVGVEALRTKFAVAGLNPAMTPTIREYGAIMAAGMRAAGEARATADGAAKFAFRCGHKRLRRPLQDFLWALCDGGRPRAEDLNAAASSSASTPGSDDEEAVSDLIADLESRSGSTSG